MTFHVRNILWIEASHNAGAQEVNATGSIFFRGNEILNILISSLWCEDKARR